MSSSASDASNSMAAAGTSSSPTSSQSTVPQEGESSGDGTSRTVATTSTRERPPGRDFLMTRIPPAFVFTAFPVKGVSFCSCLENGVKCRYLQCKCGEDDIDLEWEWDEETAVAANIIEPELRTVHFQVKGSSGTAAVRGNKVMTHDQYFWEIKMITSVYGTDMMVGVGTEAVKLDKFRNQFCSMLGRDEESWGLSYQGRIQHAGQMQQYSSVFGQGTLIGVHLDMWHGTLAFYKNRRPLGIAFRGLNGKQLYPMLSSTAALTGMKLIKARSFLTSLQFLCCQGLRRIIPPHLDVFDVLPLPPGLKDFLDNNFSWLLQRSNGDGVEEEQMNVSCNADTDDEDAHSDDSTFHPSSPSSFPSPSPSSCASSMEVPSSVEFSVDDSLSNTTQTPPNEGASIGLDDTLRMLDASAAALAHRRGAASSFPRNMSATNLSDSMPLTSSHDENVCSPGLDETLKLLDEAATRTHSEHPMSSSSQDYLGHYLRAPSTAKSGSQSATLCQLETLSQSRRDIVYQDAQLSTVPDSGRLMASAGPSKLSDDSDSRSSLSEPAGISSNTVSLPSLGNQPDCDSDSNRTSEGESALLREMKRKAEEQAESDDGDRSQQKRWRTDEEGGD